MRGCQDLAGSGEIAEYRSLAKGVDVVFASLHGLLAQAESSMVSISPSDIIPVLAITLGIGGGVLVALTGIIMGTWRKVRDRKIVASLIQDMLDRNMSAVEIQQVMSTWQAASDSDAKIPDAYLAAPHSARPPKLAKGL